MQFYFFSSSSTNSSHLDHFRRIIIPWWCHMIVFSDWLMKHKHRPLLLMMWRCCLLCAEKKTTFVFFLSSLLRFYGNPHSSVISSFTTRLPLAQSLVLQDHGVLRWLWTQQWGSGERALHRCVNSSECGRSSVHVHVYVFIYNVYIGQVYSLARGKCESTRGRHLRQKTAWAAANPAWRWESWGETLLR